MTETKKTQDITALKTAKPLAEADEHSHWKHLIGVIFSWTLTVIASVICALGFSIFQVPHNIASGGVSGIGIIINHFTGFPVGTFYLLTNIPLLILGYFHLGRWQFVVRTMLAVVVFSIATDVFLSVLPGMLKPYPVSKDLLLCSIYAGIMAGVGGGLLHHTGATIGGTAIIGRILQRKTGIPLSQVYLYTDGVIIMTAGLIFGWEISLYALLTLVLSGMLADYTLDGPSSIRVAHIVTTQPKEVSQILMTELNRGVSSWNVTGEYTGEVRTMLMCTIFRPQVHDLKRLVTEVDPQAFVTIAVGYQAIGFGFIKPKKPTTKPKRIEKPAKKGP